LLVVALGIVALVVGVAQHRSSTPATVTENLKPQDVKAIMSAVSRGRWILLQRALRNGNFKASGELLRDIALGRSRAIAMDSPLVHKPGDVSAIAVVHSVYWNRGGSSYNLVLETNGWKLVSAVRVW
jgi:hypothetical protein